MEEAQVIINELSNNERWLPEDYKCSRYYREYLDVALEDLKKVYR